MKILIMHADKVYAFGSGTFGAVYNSIIKKVKENIVSGKEENLIFEKDYQSFLRKIKSIS